MTRIASACISLLVTLSLTGCAFGPSASPVAEPGIGVHGIVHGGQQPIAGQKVYVLAANTTGYPTASTNSSVSLLTTGDGQNSSGASVLPNAYYVLTQADGTFTLSSKYSCSTGQQVYLYGVSGYTDGNSSDANPNIGLMAVIGNCDSNGAADFSGLFVNMNEITTVAAAYAMSGFAYDATHVSSPNTTLALRGITNAFNNAALIANLAAGTAASNVTGSGTTTGITVPSAQINTDGNILASCINETPANFGNCTTLFANTGSSGGSSGTTPTDTATATINLAHHPYISSTVNTNLFNLAGATGAPFVGGSQPTDWTMQILLANNGLIGSREIAIDQFGNAWVPNYNTGSGTTISVFLPNGTAASTTNSQLTSAGSPLSGNSLDGPDYIAFDTLGNAWVTNNTTSTVSIFTSTGAVSTINSSTPLSGNGLTTPAGIAFDVNGNAWVGNHTTNDVSVFTSTGAAATTTNTSPAFVANSPLTTNTTSNVYDLAFDMSGNAWVVNEGNTTVSIFTSTGGVSTINSSTPLSGNSMASPTNIVIDANGNAWVGNTPSGDPGLSGFTSTGAVATGSPVGAAAGGIHSSYGVAVDGGNKVFTADENSANLGEMDPTTGAAISPTGTSATTGGFSHLGSGAYSVAIDGSGTAWEVNSPGSIDMYIGLATPVVTPVIANRLAPYATNNSPVNKP